MDQLAAEALPGVSHFTFSIFNVAVPNLIVVGVVVLVWIVAVWCRLPRFVEISRRESRGEET